MIDPTHATDLQNMQEITKQVAAEVKKDRHTRDKVHQTKIRDQVHMGKAVQAQVTKGGQWKL